MTVKTAIVLGKGPLAAKIAQWFHDGGDYALLGIVPVDPEPEWCRGFVAWADEHDVPVLALHDMAIRNKDVLFSCFYDRMIPVEVLSTCDLPLNLHPSPLPWYRGVRPINWALKNGRPEHGATVHVMTDKLDAGPIVAQVKFCIDPMRDEVEDVYRRTLLYAWPLFEDAMEHVKRGDPPLAQNEAFACTHYAHQNDLLGDRAGWRRP